MSTVTRKLIALVPPTVSAVMLVLSAGSVGALPLREFPICTEGADQDRPAISGDIVVWYDKRSAGGDIYGKDLSTGTEFPICTNGASQVYAAISGDIVVWQDSRNGNLDIYGKDLSTGTEFPICTDGASQERPAISGDIVVWRDARNGNYDIYGKDLSTSTEFPVCTDGASQLWPAIWGDIVVWQDSRNGNNDIYGKDLSTDTEFPICTQGAMQEWPAISGDIVVWHDSRNGNNDIYGKALSTGTEFPICTDDANQSQSAISGDIVVWQDYRNGDLDVYGKYLSAGTDFPVCARAALQYYPAISGDIMVWLDTRNGNWDIYGAGPTPHIVWVNDDWTGMDNAGGHLWQYNAFSVIQDGMDVVNEGGTVVVHGGSYTENIDFKGKAITVRSTDPSDPAVVAATIVDGGGAGSAVTFASGEGAGSVLAGLTIVNGSAPSGGGIYCEASSPTISGTTISGNSAMDGGGIYCYQSSPTISNNTIGGNTATDGGGGICCEESPASISSNTITGNTATDGGGIYCSDSSLLVMNSILAFSGDGGGIHVGSGTPPTVRYCDVYGNAGGDYVGMADPTGTNGNLSVDPLFADAGGGDFHLKSRGGRFLPGSGGIALDAVDSPCIDAGDPASDYRNESAPNGNRVNMGAYGNTRQASRSWVGPSAPTLVEITPGSPTTTDDLTANASGATDPQGDPLTYEYKWSKTTDGGATWSEWSDRRQLDRAAGDGATDNVLDHRLTAKGEEWKARARAYDGVLYGPWAESAPVTIGNSPPTLEWVGMPGFVGDGHDPAAGAPDSTEFALRVKITDPDGTAPAQMTVQLQRVEDSRTWVTITTLPLSSLFGTWTTGMMCGATTTLPNGAYRYCFYAEDDEGAAGAGDPAAWTRGPKLIAPPQLWCTGLPGREGDYLDPETGIAEETRFKFSVQCTDSEGDAPVPRRIEIQRKRADGTWRGFSNVVMAAWGGGLRGGKYYNFQRKLPAGEYRYRFAFADNDGPATGSDSAGPDATQWQPGPMVGEASAALDRVAGEQDAVLTSLNALPGAGGAQIVFSLSAPMAVDARILNLAGRPAKTLCRAKECEAGTNTFLWDARSDSGLPVPNGTYLVEVTVRSADGDQARALAQVRIDR